MFSDLQNVLFPPLGRESRVSWKETHDGHIPWHELAKLSGACMFVWILWHCKQRLGERDGCLHSSRGLCWQIVSYAEICLSCGDTGFHLLCHRNHPYYKALPWSLKVLALITSTEALPKCTCCHGLLLCQTLLGINHLRGLQEFRSSAICCRDFT